MSTAEATAVPVTPEDVAAYLAEYPAHPVPTAEEWRGLFGELNEQITALTKLRTLAESTAFGNLTDDELRAASRAAYDLGTASNYASELAHHTGSQLGLLLNARGLITHYQEEDAVGMSKRHARRDAYTGPKPKVGDWVRFAGVENSAIWAVIEVDEAKVCRPVRAQRPDGLSSSFDYYMLAVVEEAPATFTGFVPKVGDRVKFAPNLPNDPCYGCTGTVVGVDPALASCSVDLDPKLVPMGNGVTFYPGELAPADEAAAD